MTALIDVGQVHSPHRKEQQAPTPANARVGVLEGDLTDMPAITEPVDTVIHSASSVSFDPPIDDAFRTNVGGARNLYEALLASGQDPHVIHVSTAYVGGISKGLRQEGSLRSDVDWRAEFDAALAARERVEALRLADIFRANVVDSTLESFIFQITGSPEKIDAFADLMRPLGLHEMARTGVAAMSRGV